MDLSGHKTRSAFERYVIEDTKRRSENLNKRDELFRLRLADKDAESADKVAEFPRASKEK